MRLLPREHGAYGQLALPLVTALTASGPTAAALLLTVSVVAVFVAHEAASILLGLRGPRAGRELRLVAQRGLAACAGIAAVTGILGVLWMDASARWSLAVPAVPALLLAACWVRGAEKSWYGEVAAAATFAGLAMPLSMAAGETTTTGVAIALPFALLFVAGTLAIRVAILRVRGGGAARATSSTRRSTIAVAVAGLVSLAWLTYLDVLPMTPLVAAIPGLMLALGVVVRPPRPVHLRAIGWSIVATGVFAATVLAAAT